MPICRDCHQPKILAISYSRTASVCLDCAEKRGLPFLLTLKTHLLETLPFIWLQRAGFLDAVRAEVRLRKGEPEELSDATKARLAEILRRPSLRRSRRSYRVPALLELLVPSREARQ